MAYVITCDCGYVSRGETEDELVEEANRHIDEVHPDIAGQGLSGRPAGDGRRSLTAKTSWRRRPGARRR